MLTCVYVLGKGGGASTLDYHLSYIMRIWAGYLVCRCLALINQIVPDLLIPIDLMGLFLKTATGSWVDVTSMGEEHS